MSKTTKPTQKLKIREQVYEHLRQRMRSGTITLTDRLVDHEIAAALAVSRMPVREALLQLKSEGLLEGTSRGFRLRQFTPTDIAQMFEVRLLLEPAAACSACEKASVAGLAHMKKAVESSQLAHDQNDAVAYMAAQTMFRQTWIGMVPNPHLAAMITRLADHVEAVRLATLSDPEFRSWSLSSSHQLLEAFLKKDPQLVEQAVHYNLRNAATSYYATQDRLISAN
ncbi:GntR family transcriptional regulator [Mesopusillimonas faecipullorum]|nr:GntR family transcriptional regulator [Mesopusillimonas faecipullorum]